MPYVKKYTTTTKTMPYRKPVRKYKKVAKKRPYRVYRKKRVGWVNPSRKLNQTVAVCFKTDESLRKYFTPIAEKRSSLTTTYQINDAIDSTLADLITSDARLGELMNNFRWYRCYAIKVKLIPEKYTANVLVSQGAGLQDGQKPRIHWISDDGSTYASAARWTTDDLKITIQEAETNQKYRTREFTRNMVFWIRPYRRNLTVGSDGYTSANTWTPTSVQHLAADLNTRLPNYNLLFGFTDVPSEWKYRTEVDYYFCFKDIKPTAG